MLTIKYKYYWYYILLGEARVIRLQDIRQKLSQIKGQIEQKVFLPYLLDFIQTPNIDEDKLLVFISILEELELSEDQLNNYALTAMLIQIALDTHEQVSNNQIDNEKETHELTARQLTVLAGDYYSGLYYKILADSENIAMIKVLAHGIKEVNEHKIFVYQREFDEMDHFIASIKIIESSLVVKLIDYFQINVWTDAITNFLLVKRLFEEKNRYTQFGSSSFFEAMKKIIFPKQNGAFKDLAKEQQQYLLALCDRYIEFSKSVIESGMQRIPHMNELLKDRMYSIVNQHTPIANTFVEEG